MPLMHAEDLAVLEEAVSFFERFTDACTADFARRHLDVIARFGRFPHRNAAPAGYRCTAAESGFGSARGWSRAQSDPESSRA
ncbi:MAG: DUF924 family protein [Prochlorococcaceae cyanobacterium]